MFNISIVFLLVLLHYMTCCLPYLLHSDFYFLHCSNFNLFVPSALNCYMTDKMYTVCTQSHGRYNNCSPLGSELWCIKHSHSVTKIYSQHQIQKLKQRPSLLQRQIQILSLKFVSQQHVSHEVTCLTMSSISVFIV